MNLPIPRFHANFLSFAQNPAGVWPNLLGKSHDYLPDFVGTLSDGTLLIAEAGRESEKSRGQALARAEAARRLAQLKGGVYWIGTDENLSELRHNNLLYLHARRRPFRTYEEIAARTHVSSILCALYRLPCTYLPGGRTYPGSTHCCV